MTINTSDLETDSASSTVLAYITGDTFDAIRTVKSVTKPITNNFFKILPLSK
jgi:hypothetical protein